MGLVDRILVKLDRFAIRYRQFMCNHSMSVARVELVPGYEHARYYRECECGLTWEE